MKSLLAKMGIILLMIGLIILGNIEVWGADWCHYGTSDTGQFYYDKDSITFLPEGVVRVRERVIRDDDLEKAFEENKESTQKFIEGKVSGKKAISKEESKQMYEEWQKEFLRNVIIAEKRMLIELKCGDKIFRLMSGIDYDEKGKVKRLFQLLKQNGYTLFQKHLLRNSMKLYVLKNRNEKGRVTHKDLKVKAKEIHRISS